MKNTALKTKLHVDATAAKAKSRTKKVDHGAHKTEMAVAPPVVSAIDAHASDSRASAPETLVERLSHAVSDAKEFAAIAAETLMSKRQIGVDRLKLGARDVGQKIERGARDVGEKMERGARDVGDAVKSAAHDVGDAFSRALRGEPTA